MFIEISKLCSLIVETGIYDGLETPMHQKTIPGFKHVLMVGL